MLRLGDEIEGRYEILEPLGQGGMGKVWKASDKKINPSSFVAIKEFEPQADFKLSEEKKQNLREGFLKEAELLAGLEHEAFPKVRDYVIYRETPCIVMDYVSGKDFATLLSERNNKPLEISYLYDWLEQLLDALDYLHSNLVIHKDIKPENLKLTQNGKIKVLDFGIAKGAIGEMTIPQRSIALGTPQYAPLEQALKACPAEIRTTLAKNNKNKVERFISKATCPQTDIFALCATIYRIFGKMPPEYSSTSRASYIWNGEKDPLPFLHEINRNVPQKIAELIKQGMNLEIEDRIESASIMKQALRQIREEAEKLNERKTREIWLENEREKFENEANLKQEMALLEKEKTVTERFKNELVKQEKDLIENFEKEKLKLVHKEREQFEKEKNELVHKESRRIAGLIKRPDEEKELELKFKSRYNPIRVRGNPDDLGYLTFKLRRFNQIEEITARAVILFFVIILGGILGWFIGDLGIPFLAKLMISNLTAIDIVSYISLFLTVPFLGAFLCLVFEFTLEDFLDFSWSRDEDSFVPIGWLVSLLFGLIVCILTLIYCLITSFENINNYKIILVVSEVIGFLTGVIWIAFFPGNGTELEVKILDIPQDSDKNQQVSKNLIQQSIIEPIAFEPYETPKITSFKIVSIAMTDRGLSEKHTQNQDAYLDFAERGIFSVADGVGEAQGGEVASQMAMEILGEAFLNTSADSDAEEVMQFAITQANSSIYQMSHDLPQLSTMATTIVALHVAGNIATIGHVGNSRLYRLDGNGNLYRETHDHTVVEEEVRAGRMTPAQAANHPSRNVISRALGAEPTVEIDMKTIMFESQTSFLLCSDGITRHVDDFEIRNLMLLDKTPAEICAEMKRICYERGAEDNLTAIIVQIADKYGRF